MTKPTAGFAKLKNLSYLRKFKCFRNFVLTFLINYQKSEIHQHHQ